MQALRLFEEGQKLHQSGKLVDALKRYERAVSIQPVFPEASIFKAVVLQQLGKTNEAVSVAEEVIKNLKKEDPLVLVNYGVVMKNAGRFVEAENAYKRVLKSHPKLLSALSNLATIYMVQGKLDEASESFSQLTRLMEDPAPWLNLARIELQRGDSEKSLEYVAKAQDLDPSHPEGLMLEAAIAVHDKNFEAGYRFVMRALDRAPAHREIWQIIQSIDPSVFDLDELSVKLEALTRLNVQSTSVLSIAVDLCRKHWIWNPLQALEKMLSVAFEGSIDKVPTSADIFTLLGANITQHSHALAASKCWSELSKNAKGCTFNHAKREKKNKVRVGIISSDLRGHAIGYLVVGLFENLPKQNIEWWAYSNSASDSSSVRERLRDNFDRFINISKLNDFELAQKIYEDQIDVIIELNQMTSGTRAPVMALRPAPVQIQWLGMPGTLGAGSDVDYIIVDPWVVDNVNENGFSENFLFLPRSYQPNDHVKVDMERLCKSRNEAGLPEDGVILGVFNQYYKFSPDTIKLWGEIFRSINNAYLWLLEPKNDQLKARILSTLAAEGIDPDQVIFAPHKPQSEHLARLRWMDLVLDTWPYNAHTTCSDALRAGVPVLTLPGTTFASRVASGILNSANLPEWVASSRESYVSKAVEYITKSRAEIDAIKGLVSQVYWSSPMVDNKWLGNAFEAICLSLYSQFNHGIKPHSQFLGDDLSLSPLKKCDGIETDAYAADSGILTSDTATERYTEQSLELSENRLYPWQRDIRRGGVKPRLHNIGILKEGLIGLKEFPLVVDVGASKVEAPQKYEGMVDAGYLTLVGFEPDSALFQNLESNANRCYLPYAIGDGKTGCFNVCRQPGMNSLLEPDYRWLDQFPMFSEWAKIGSTIEVKTTRLDDVLEIKGARYLKLDIQGYEAVALENGTHLLQDIAMLQIKASPQPLYKGEKSFFELGSWLMKQGFILHTFLDTNRRSYKPFVTDETPYMIGNQIFQVEAVFIPDPLRWSKLANEHLQSLAFLSHSILESFDVCMKVLDILDKRDQGTRVEAYRVYLETAGLDA